MSDTTYLGSGFLVVIQPNGKFRLPQLDMRVGQVTRQVLAVVEALNRGYRGDLVELAESTAKDFAAPAAELNTFLRMLEDSGFLVATSPVAMFDTAATVSNNAIANLSGEITIATPVGLVSQSGKFLWYDHEGVVRERLDLSEIQAVAAYAKPATLGTAWGRYQAKRHPHALDERQFRALAERLAAAGLLAPAIAVEQRPAAKDLNAVNRQELLALVDARTKEHDAAMAHVAANLLPVVPVNEQQGTAPMSLGQVMAYAMEFDGGRLRQRYNFVPMFLTDEVRLAERARTPGIFLFSNYIWNLEANLHLSSVVKAANPDNITVHGGPSTPKYRADVDAFYADNPHVDVCVRGEGEATFAALLDAIDAGDLRNLEALRDVAGINFRSGDAVVMTPDRERITDLNTIPSSILMGLFDEFGAVSSAFVLETNRGCPYGCTFCDWGSSTLSKVRRFDLERVYSELEWCARHGVKQASIADANFGMLERDVEIVEKVAELKRQYGFPRTVNINYAKNQVRYLRKIIEILAEANILAEGVASLQSMDEQTLKVIDRSNIKLEKYTELATEFRRARLPLAADIMMGLPGSTPASFASDLQRCTDRDIRVRANPTQLLPNSPMNEPEYRKKHGIVAKPGEFLKETATYTREEWEHMERLRQLYYIFDTYGVLRYVARFVRRETGLGEVAFYDSIRSEVLSRPGDYPVIAGTLGIMERYMAPVGSWSLFLEEVRRHVVEYLGVADDAALQTALAVQLAHIPAAGREFPLELHLAHDFAAWQQALFDAREAGHQDDWEHHIPRLSEFGPAVVTIDDPNEICRRDVGVTKYELDMNLRNWELDSPVARPRLSNVPTLAAVQAKAAPGNLVVADL